MNKTLITLAGLLLPLTLQAQFSQPVRDVENPAQNLFVATGFENAPSGFVAVLLELPVLPQGKRLTVEALTISCRLPNDAWVRDAFITTLVRSSPGSSPKESRFRISMAKQGEPGNSTTTWTGSLVGRVFTDYIDTTRKANIYVFRSPNGDFSCEYALNGGLTNLPL